jgi:hypothetical protein
MSIRETVEWLTETPQLRRRNSRLWGKVAARRSSRSAFKKLLLAPSSILGLEPERFFAASGLSSHTVVA